MKKHFLSLFALASMVFASSCTSEEIISQSTGNEVAVTFTADLRYDVKSRAVGDDTNEIDELVFAVYDENEELLPSLTKRVSDQEITLSEVKTDGTRTATITVTLVKGQTYSFVFWAQDKDYTAYSFDEETATVSINYGQEANNYSADAFFAKINDFTVTGTFEQTVTLKRPFAQVNFLTTPFDLEKAKAAGFEPSQSSIVVENAATSLNLLDGNVSGSTAATFNLADIVAATETTTIKNSSNSYITWDGTNVRFSSSPNAEYACNFRYLATAYFLPTEATGEAEITASMSVTGNTTKSVDLTAAGITAQRNYRTNIYGNLLTSNGQFNVVVNPDFDGDHSTEEEEPTTQVVGTIAEANALMNPTDGSAPVTNVTITEAPTAAEAINLPNTGEEVTIYFAFDEGATPEPITIQYPTGATQTPSNIEVNGDAGDLEIIAPESTVILNGSYNNVIIASASNTLIVPKGAKIKKLTVKQGNVRIADGGEVTEILRSEDNEDAVTYVIYEGTLPEEVNDNELIAYVSAAEFDLIAAAANDGEVKLTSNVELTRSLVVAAGVEMTIDLNGFTISQEKNQTAGYQMILNDGNLTIMDSAGNGKISYTDSGNGGSYVSNTITNRGTLTVKSGTIENSSSEAMANVGYAYAIDTSIWGEATETVVNIEGGEIKSIYSPLRVRADSDTEKVEANISGGTFYGRIDHQMSSSKAGVIGILNISGGTFKQFGIKETSLQIFGAGLETDASGIVANITGGDFEGGIVVYRGEYVPLGKNFNENFISGGTFSVDPSEYLADGYKAVEETGSYKIVEDEVAKIGSITYPTLKKAIEAVNEGGIITLLKNVTFTQNNRTYNSGDWYDGLYYIGDKSFTIDLNEKTINQNGAVNDYLLNFKNDGTKENTITLKNGTIDAGESAYCAIATASSNAQKITMNLESIELIGENSGGAVVKFRGGGELNVKAGTKITGEDSYTCIEAAGNNTVVNIYEGAELYQNGTSSYVGSLVGVSQGATANVYGGKGISKKCALAVYSTGGTINSMGGEWTANADGTVPTPLGDNNLNVLLVQNNTYEQYWVSASVMNVTGGTYKGGMSATGYTETSDARLNITGGNFNADPSAYVVAGYESTQSAGIYTVGKPKALIALEEAIANGGNVTLTEDVKLIEALTITSGEVTLDLNGKTITAATTDAFIANSGAKLTLKNGNISSHEAIVRAIGGEVVIESGKYVQTGTAVGSTPATYRYGIDAREGGKITINGGEFESNNGILNVNSGCEIVINDGKFTNKVEKSMTRHFAYVGGKLIIEDGEFSGVANAGAGGCFFCGAASGAEIQINGGKFTSLWTTGKVNKIFESYYGGTINVMGGMFNTNGGITSFVEANTDEATKAAYPYVAK